MQRIKLNDNIIFERKYDDDFSGAVDGRDICDIVKLAIAGSSDVMIRDKHVIDLMDDDEAKEARSYFGVFQSRHRHEAYRFDYSK